MKDTEAAGELRSVWRLRRQNTRIPEYLNNSRLVGGCTGLLEVKHSPALRCTASKSAIVYGFMRRVGITGEPAAALNHAAAELVLQDGARPMHARVECGWPGGLLGGFRPG